jgi:hypothetical protein
MASDIDHILSPKPLHILSYQTPVRCNVWKGNKISETIELHVYPFDTIDTLKYLIYAHYNQADFLPRFTFVGIGILDNFIPLEYLWYPIGANKVKDTYELTNPADLRDDLRFVTDTGEYASPNYELRGRSTIEDVFLKTGGIPTLHIFPLTYLLRLYKGIKPISDEEWNKKFAPYFVELTSSTYQATAEDKRFGEVISSFVDKRYKTLTMLEEILMRSESELSPIKVDGIQQLQLIWKKPVEEFEGAASVFYNISATERRPYIRLLPSEGSSITKLHVKGVLPIPTLDDPRHLEVWSKETSVTPGTDMCVIKYVHRPLISISQSIYGTIHILNDGTVSLLLQPPKQIRKLDPDLDFRHFTRILTDVFIGLPQHVDAFDIKELAIMLKLSTKTRFNRTRIQQRLPFFSTFFTEINGLPDERKFMTLRYKAVSQYASEDELFTFITQHVSEHKIQGEFFGQELIDSIKYQFQFTDKDARNAIQKWLAKKGQFTVQAPEDGDFTESFNSGIDIQLYAQHPLYSFQLYHVNSFQSYERICTLLSILFTDNDALFRNAPPSFQEEEKEVEQAAMNQEHKHEEVEPEADFENPFDDEPETDASTIAQITQLQQLANNNDDLFDTFAYESNNDNSNAAKPATSTVVASPAKPAVVQYTPATTKATVAAIATVATVPKKQVDLDQKKIDPKSWFITKLQQIDNELFGFSPDKDANGYSRQCGNVDDRQPAILTKDQYERMREIYKNDNIFWIVYPLDKDEDPVEPLRNEETFTVMRYGSDGDHINYLFCPEYFCISDELMIRKKDFEGRMDREGNPKPANTCPFCKGTLINKRMKGAQGATVLQRKTKDTGSYPKHIRFLSKSTHPKGIALPCCFIKQSTLRISSPEFTHLRDYLQEQQLDKLEDGEKEEKDYGDLVFRADDAIDYEMRFLSVHKLSIIEYNKQPRPGIFAIVPPQFDEFFFQDTTSQIITRSHIILKLKPDAEGFIRIGTQNTPHESLLGVIAPILNLTTIKDVQDRIKAVLKPRMFINAHFGNLVLEFYNPVDKSAMPVTRQELAIWSQTNLGISLNSDNSYEVIRIFNSYRRFIRFIDDSSHRKDLRHIQPLLAEPGLFSQNGIQLVIMEDDEDKITIKCPVFGISTRHRNNDFVFISKTIKTISYTQSTYNRYELYLYTKNLPAKGGQIEIHDTIVKWNAQSRSIWPTIVRQRIDEYTNQCQSRYISLYTPHSHINPMTIIPLTYAYDLTNPRFIAIIKDAYNHIVAVAFRHTPGINKFVALPVIDDGAVSISSALSIKHIYLNWNDFKSAPLEDVIQYYRENLEGRLVLYPGYKIKHIVRDRATQEIVAIQLQNNIYVPVAPPKDLATINQFGLPIVEIEEFPWDIDKRLDGQGNDEKTWDELTEGSTLEKRCGTDPELEKKVTHSEFEELFQQFRYMVSSYIVQQQEVKTMIEEIIFNKDLPYYEKRKRLLIYLSSLSSWFYSDSEWEASVSFLRKDCRLIDRQDACTGTCKWKAEEKEDAANGVCLLHVKDQIPVGDRQVNTAELFIKRVIDELIYFPNRRKQLMKKGEISMTAKIIKPIHYRDQYIIPESSISWANLLRLEWTRETSDRPKYYEEMSRDGVDEHIQGTLPPELQERLGNSLRLYIPEDQDPARPFLSFLGVLEVGLDQLAMTETSTSLTRKNLTRYVLNTQKQIGVIDTANDYIEYVRATKEILPTILVFVLIDNKVGLLLENDGIPYVNISSLPEPDTWFSAEKVGEKQRKPVKIVEPVPLLADEKEEAPLIPAEPRVAKPFAAAMAARKARKGLATEPVVAKSFATAMAARKARKASTEPVVPASSTVTTVPVASTAPVKTSFAAAMAAKKAAKASTEPIASVVPALGVPAASVVPSQSNPTKLVATSFAAPAISTISAAPSVAPSAALSVAPSVAPSAALSVAPSAAPSVKTSFAAAMAARKAAKAGPRFISREQQQDN